MIRKPVFRPAFHVEVVEPEGVYLLSERGHVMLGGLLHCRIAPLLDGRHTADDIADRLTGQARPAEVYYALDLLEKKGYVLDADGAVSPERAAFWDALDLDTQQAERRLRESTVSLVRFGAVPIGPLASALAALNIRAGPNGDIAVVVTDDYLQDGLAEFNVAALTAGRPWLLAKPLGAVLWIGPLFRPGRTACWECLAQRLRGNRPVESYLQHHKRTESPFPVSRASLTASFETAIHLAAMETVKAIACGQEQAPDCTLTTLDLASLETQKHAVVRRPQCPRCGDPAYRSTPEPIPLTLQSRKKRFTADGGHRTVSPEQTIAKYEHHISPITGAVTQLTRVPVDEDPLMRVYAAGHNPPVNDGSLRHLRHTVRKMSAGKGMTDAQARASGLCEALERYSADLRGGEISMRASYRALGASAIHPNACMLFSEAQYRRREAWNARVSSYSRVPDPLDEGADVAWTPVWSLTAREFRYVPTGYCYLSCDDRALQGARFCWPDSNGNAAGNTPEEAILQGFLELVERDSVALWWYNRVRRPAVDLDSFDERYVQELRSRYRQLNRDVWVLDLTSDLRIPAFAAISRRVDTAEEDIILGFGAHFDPRIGILRALTELNQRLVPGSRSDGSGEHSDEDPELRRWSKAATLSNQPYLAPADSGPRARSDDECIWSDDLREDVLRCQEIVERQGMEMLVLDLTRPDIGLPVVKVIVPGLRHFRPRLAPGRLYDVPVKTGWLDRPLAEDELNPIPFFFP